MPGLKCSAIKRKLLNLQITMKESSILKLRSSTDLHIDVSRVMSASALFSGRQSVVSDLLSDMQEKNYRFALPPWFCTDLGQPCVNNPSSVDTHYILKTN